MENKINDQALTTIDLLNDLPVIKSGDDYVRAGELWKAGRDMLEQIDSGYDSIIKAAHKAHKEAVAKKKSVYEPVEGAVKRIKRLMADYDMEQEHIRRQEQARLEAEARKAEEDRRLAEAIAVEQSGNRDEADRIMEEVITLPPVVIRKTVPKIEGMVMREIWKFEVVDPAAVPRDYLKIDEVKIGQVVRAMKSGTAIPGVRVYAQKV